MEEFLSKIPRRWIGALIGLVVSLLLLFLGFWKLLFIMLCVGLGYFIGHYFEGGQSFENLIQRLFPSR